ncbi:hypothetical protein cce_2858 [Crocosphaera subtropica ATCC 51142]|uniref:Uncharacterized protein n=1 Tax=Crocosphaera subtropica (strain ATCC 51142 / BH68) TaxID=43989 RepID=B1WV09_CROS5|nr:hypothetical protein cce_2858 [Crocosphaera subtropica ATCC 51142]
MLIEFVLWRYEMESLGDRKAIALIGDGCFLLC